jgi:thiamine-phosphate pyrophosphorylase
MIQALAEIPGVGDVAAVLLRCADMDRQTASDRIAMLAPIVQKNGVALLADAPADLVAGSEADGAHVASIGALKAALDVLKPRRIVGAGGLKTRHDAMLAGESGADYVMFGEPDADGRRPAFDAVAERVAWWAEVFEVPCVGFAGSGDEIEALVSAGADFVAVDFIWTERRGATAALCAAAERLAVREPAR